MEADHRPMAYRWDFQFQRVGPVRIKETRGIENNVHLFAG